MLSKETQLGRFGDEPARPPFAYEDIASALTVRHIQTPARDLLGFEPNTPAGEAAAVLETRRIDFAPVMQANEIVGRVGLSSLLDSPTDLVGALAVPLATDYLVTADVAISQVMKWLLEHPWLLVIDGRHVSGVVTPSDLNRQAARTYFYLLIADFEIRLADYTRRFFDDQTKALALMSGERRADIEVRFKNATSRDIESDLVAAMDFSDLLHVAKRFAPIHQAFGFTSGTSWTNATGRLAEFRHEIMHPVRGILDDQKGLSRLIAIEDRLRSLLTS